MPRKSSAQITFNVTDKKTRDALNKFAKQSGFRSAGDLARHLLQEASNIQCVPEWGGDRTKDEDDNS